MVAERRGRDTPRRGSREHISERVDEQVVDPLEAKRADLAEAEKNLTTLVTHQAVSNRSCTQVASDHEDCVQGLCEGAEGVGRCYQGASTGNVWSWGDRRIHCFRRVHLLRHLHFSQDSKW